MKVKLGLCPEAEYPLQVRPGSRGCIPDAPPRPETEARYLVLADRFLSSGPPGKSLKASFISLFLAYRILGVV